LNYFGRALQKEIFDEFKNKVEKLIVHGFYLGQVRYIADIIYIYGKENEKIGESCRTYSK
jgi:hypothetical protein